MLILVGFGLQKNLFIENKGQVDDNILYYTLSGIMVNKDNSINIGSLNIYLKDAYDYLIEPQYQEGAFSYFMKGSVQAKSYRSLRFRNIYDSINMVINGLNNNRFEFYFEVKKGGDPSKIVIVSNKQPVQKNNSIYLDNVVISDVKAYEGTKEVKIVPVISGNEITYNIGEYDKNNTLIIDPIVAMLVSAHNDFVVDLAYDNVSNSIFAVGCTNGSAGFSVSPQSNFGGVGAGFYDVFIVKLNSTLNTHIHTSFIGSVPNASECAYGVELDSNGDIYVVGYTERGDSFATQPSNIFGTPGGKDAFLAKLDNGITNLLRVVIFSSPMDDEAFDLDLKGGKVYIIGYTSNSQNFTNLTSNVFGTLGNKDAFVISLDTNIIANQVLALVASNGDDIARSIILDKNTNVFITGWTNSYINFAPNRVLIGTGGNNDAFVTKLNQSLNNHIATVILASSMDDYSYTIARDSLNDIFIGGSTKNSSDFTCFNCPNKYTYGSINNKDAFVVKLDNNLLTFKTAILGSLVDSEAVRGVHINKNSQFLYAVGYTQNSSTFTPNQTIYGTTSGSGQTDAFLVTLSNNLSSFYRTYIYTGSDNDFASCLVEGWGGVTYIGGYTVFGSNFICNGCSSKYIYGPMLNAYDGFVIFHDVPYKDYENKRSEKVYYKESKIVFNLDNSNYVGFEVFSLDGRLVLSKSLGYLLPGEYSFELSLKGGYIIKIRIGELVKYLKL
ncbi:MAG: SBBP repeat-containing protein [candidate division WOR-3 bacterium]|nr:SBBP repeat-containing protein [candidate division WOR-3 bacterium]MDW8150381.1 SBBP repeat-containing protein [candidate division WOR-3 bacterium]